MGEPADTGELLSEHADLETGVTFGRGSDQLLVGEPARRTDGVNVQVVPWLTAAVQGGDLVANRIGQAQHRADVEAHRFVLAPVHAQVDIELAAVACGDVQPRELWCAASLVDGETRSRSFSVTWSTAALNSVTSWLAVNRSTSSVGRSIMPCSRIAPEPAKAKPSTPARAILATSAARRRHAVTRGGRGSRETS